eukprot:TRINITY_DN8044_c0_g1_i13.p1 TRINITY_DN8044_c0_g1~~TRINITY_DN8044_c0_g1_i13.p1  ORF type:complete len:253 (-),score=52.99 TRINITY_DN8044_c0_g1_i13:261-1019(-)
MCIRDRYQRRVHGDYQNPRIQQMPKKRTETQEEVNNVTDDKLKGKSRRSTSELATAAETDTSQVVDENESMGIETEQVNAKSKADRFSKAPKEKRSTGVIYVGHLPYGFVEEGLKEFFSQYGDVIKVKLVRSKKTARSKGYAFIQFKYKEVAKIAADNVNGHILYGRRLVSRYLEDDGNGLRFRNAGKRFKYYPWKQIFIKQINKEKSSKEMKKSVFKLLKGEKEKREELARLGINYDFPGYVSSLVDVKPQ